MGNAAVGGELLLERIDIRTKDEVAARDDRVNRLGQRGFE